MAWATLVLLAECVLGVYQIANRCVERVCRSTWMIIGAGHPELQKSFKAIALGHQHLHLVGKKLLADSAASSCPLLVESVKYHVGLKKNDIPKVEGMVQEMAKKTGWKSIATPDPHIRDTFWCF